ncbi:hypothetical protein JW758_06015 [Candidatus Peregrinibacteria bacterium]|nr:hypothetical protein [Candidatus Peregrinibacteria bacterium]
MKKQILSTTYNLSLLARLGLPEVVQPEVSKIVDELFANMFQTVIDNELETEIRTVKTRIYAQDKRGAFKTKIFKKKQKIVVADIIRGGMTPSHQYFLKLSYLLDPKLIRQDHIMAQRIETKEGVNGTSLMASKIDGSINGAIVIIPDPMGATGGSIAEVIDHYQKNFGKAKKYVVINLVITPQYIKRLSKIKAPISLYAARLDKGLTKTDFIWPGLGGVGEMINNTKK